MRKHRKKTPQILIFAEGAVKASRDKLLGILKYARIHGPCRVYFMEGRPDEQMIPKISEWGATGIISEAIVSGYSVNFHEAIIKADLPTVIFDPVEVFLSPDHSFSKFSVVLCDGEAVGKMGAEHLLERNLKTFAFVDDVLSSNWSVARRKAFVERLAQEGYSCHIYETLSESEKTDWGGEQNRMITWLHSLPKPIGIMAAMDSRGRQVIDTCHLAKIEVPYEVCVLGVDNDAIICDTTTPTMSSVMTDNENAGYLAAQILDGLMQNTIRKRRVAYYGPLYVVSRRSTDAVFIQDKLVIKALEYIQTNAGINLRVIDVAKYLKVSRRLLELRFKETLKTTVIDEIQRVRFNYIKTLLLESNLSIQEITQLCGLENSSHLAAIFKKHFGKTMTQFRKHQ